MLRCVDSLIAVSRQLTGAGNYDDATQAGEAALKLAEANFGQESATYAGCLFNRGRIFQFSSQLEQALPPYQDALAIRERVLGKESYDYAASLNNLGYVYWQLGRYPEAELRYTEALDIRKKILGEEHPEYAMSLNNLAIIYAETGRYEAAEPLYLEAKAIREKTLGKAHPDYAQSLHNLANLYNEMGRYEDAEPLFLEAQSVWVHVYGKENSNYAQTLLNLANLYNQMGRYEDAESLYLESLDILARLLGKENLLYVRDLNNLANLYTNMGRYKSAENLYLEARDILEKSAGTANADYIRNLNGLAFLYANWGRYDAAETLYLNAREVLVKVFGEENRDYAYNLNNLANLYNDTGRYGEAEPLYLEALAIRGKILGKTHPDYAGTLNNLGNLYNRMGQMDAAERYYTEAKNIQQAALGKEHPDYLVCVDNLASFYQQTSRYELARPLYQESQTIATNLLSRSARFLSNRELASYSLLFERNLNRCYSFAQVTHGVFPGFSASCYDLALFHKGMLLNIASRINRLAASDTTATRLIKRLKSYHRRLAQEYARPVAKRKDITDLMEKANTTEKELIHTVAGFDDIFRQIRWQDVQAALQPGEAAIEFVRYQYYNPNPTDSFIYAAILLKYSNPGEILPQMIPLFEERQLASQLPDGNDMDRIDESCQGPGGQAIYTLIWQPLDTLLTGVSTVYCSPSGLLHRLNLGALPTDAEHVFGDRRQLVLLGSTRQLAHAPAGSFSGISNAVLMGGINYNSVDSSGEISLTVPADGGAFPSAGDGRIWSDSTARAERLNEWRYLPATATEVHTIADMLRGNGFNAQVFSDSSASEEIFKQLGRTEPSPRILHIATHGYFFPDPAPQSPEAGVRFNSPSALGHELVFKISSDPMIRSGLILAGANAAWSRGPGTQSPAQREDGILTAYEISQQDMSNTELVVLSACETGLGQIIGNEGVYGLQRAFKIAGAKYLIMSLWQVNDLKTGELMSEFYRQYLIRKLTAPQAFRAAQQAMRARYPGSPYVWAGFVLVE